MKEPEVRQEGKTGVSESQVRIKSADLISGLLARICQILRARDGQKHGYIYESELYHILLTMKSDPAFSEDLKYIDGEVIYEWLFHAGAGGFYISVDHGKALLVRDENARGCFHRFERQYGKEDFLRMKGRIEEIAWVFMRKLEEMRKAEKKGK